MATTNENNNSTRRKALLIYGLIACSAIILILLSDPLSNNASESKESRSKPAIAVILTPVQQQPIAIQTKIKGTVLPKQTIVIRPQMSAIIKSVHIKEGQFVKRGDKLFSLDNRDRQANLAKSNAQLAKTRAELAIAKRNYRRQQELFQKNFISQATLDAAKNQVELLQNQLKFDQAAIQADRVDLSYSDIYAPISGRTGSIPFFPGSLVNPETSQLVSIMQLDPIQVSFVLPESELSFFQPSLVRDQINTFVQWNSFGEERRAGKIVFVDNSVDTASGTIQLKAEFANEDSKLWPGMFVEVLLIKQTIPDAVWIPVQAIQSGPAGQFVFGVDDSATAIMQPITVKFIQDGRAIIDGVRPGYCVVVEGAQSLRSGSLISEQSIIQPSDKTCKRIERTQSSSSGFIRATEMQQFLSF